MTRSANAKARVAQLTAFPSSFAPAGRAVVEGLALPFLKAPLLRWGPSCAVGYGGRPSVPPLRRFAGRRNAYPEGHALQKEPPPERAGEDTRPYGGRKSVSVLS